MFFIDAINLYDWAMSESLPYDENEMWNGHPDLYKKRLQEILNISDDADNGYFDEVELRYSDDKKEKNEKIPFLSWKQSYS